MKSHLISYILKSRCRRAAGQPAGRTGGLPPESPALSFAPGAPPGAVPGSQPLQEMQHSRLQLGFQQHSKVSLHQQLWTTSLRLLERRALVINPAAWRRGGGNINLNQVLQCCMLCMEGGLGWHAQDMFASLGQQAVLGACLQHDCLSWERQGGTLRSMGYPHWYFNVFDIRVCVKWSTLIFQTIWYLCFL